VRAVLVLVAVLASGCALKPAPITNPALNTVGKVAVRAAQIVNVVDIGQRQIEPLVAAEVLTAREGLAVQKAIGVALEQAKNLVAILTLADAAATVTDQVARLRDAGSQVKALLRTVGGLTTGVGGMGGRIVVGAIAGSITDAVGDLVPVGGGQ
jgi:hypothetical protein